MSRSWPSLWRLAIVVPLLILLNACAEQPPGTTPMEEDGGATPIILGGLDADGDGDLTSADLVVGEAAVFLRRFLPDGEGREIVREEAHRTTNAEFLHRTAENDWILRVPLEGVPTYFINFIFDSPGPEPTRLDIGTSPLKVVSLGVPAREHGGEGEVADDSLSLSEVNGLLASGQLDLEEVEIEVFSFIQLVPTAERLVILAAAFRDLPVQDEENP